MDGSGFSTQKALPECNINVYVSSTTQHCKVLKTNWSEIVQGFSVAGHIETC